LKCFPGYKPNQEKIVCMKTGNWEETRCKIKGSFQRMFFVSP
jgi:hypothetical protein